MTLVFNAKGGAPVTRVIAGISGRTVVWEEPLEQELVAQETRLERLAVQITIDHGDRLETYDNLALTADGKGSIVSEVNGQSRLLRVTLSGPHSSFEGTATAILSDGSDGRISLTPADYIGRGDEFEFKTGLTALADREDVNVIVCPDLYPTGEWAVEFGGDEGILAVWRAVLDHCESYPNRFALIDPPPGLTAHAASEWRTQFDSAYGAIYYPWVELVTGASDLPVDQEVIPPSGPVSGLLAKRDREDGVHHAAANAELYGVVRLAQRITYKEQEILNPVSVNCLRVFPGRGVRPYGARTLSSDASWRYVNVRRSASAIAHSIYLGTQWAVFEPNDRTLEKKLIREASAFLTGLWRKGYMQGDSPSESFHVRCDATTTTRADRDAGRIIVEIGLALAHPAEFIVVRFAQQTLQQSKS
jgi:phage tail sheath protein FI